MKPSKQPCHRGERVIGLRPGGVRRQRNIAFHEPEFIFGRMQAQRFRRAREPRRAQRAEEGVDRR